MTKKSYIAEQSPYLKGVPELSLYLHVDERTARKYVIDMGLRPRTNLGAAILYHKADVDKFVATHNQLNDI